MVDIAHHYALDKQKVEDGVEHYFGDGDIIAVLRHRSSKPVEEARKRLTRQEKKFLEVGNFEKPAIRAVLVKIVQAAFVEIPKESAPWEFGTKILKTPQEVCKVLPHEDLTGLLVDLMTAMADSSAYGKDEFEEDSKNS